MKRSTYYLFAAFFIPYIYPVTNFQQQQIIVQMNGKTSVSNISWDCPNSIIYCCNCLLFSDLSDFFYNKLVPQRYNFFFFFSPTVFCSGYTSWTRMSVSLTRALRASLFFFPLFFFRLFNFRWSVTLRLELMHIRKTNRKVIKMAWLVFLMIK